MSLAAWPVPLPPGKFFRTAIQSICFEHTTGSRKGTGAASQLLPSRSTGVPIGLVLCRVDGFGSQLPTGEEGSQGQRRHDNRPAQDLAICPRPNDSPCQHPTTEPGRSMRQTGRARSGQVTCAFGPVTAVHHVRHSPG